MPKAAPSRKRRAVRRALALVAFAFCAFVVGAVADGWSAFGHRAEGERLARMQRSPNFKDGVFVNREPLVNHLWPMLEGLLHVSPEASPSATVHAEAFDVKRLSTAPASGLRVTWLGHAAVLIEIDGQRILTDPVWSERASPFTWIGPRRWYTPPVPVDALPKLDAVLISHDHYDHLDQATVVALSKRGTRFVVPLGIGAHLAYWGVPEAQITELDWWEKARVGELELVCTPARHASGRHLFDKDSKLWAGYALIGRQRRVYFSGDTGLSSAFKDIGERLGPFDLTLIEVGQYHRAWPDWHAGPEQAVLAHQWLRGKTLLPMHWGLFTLAYHGWTEPAERVVAAAERAGVRLVVPRPGQSIEPETAQPFERWWPKVAWQNAVEHPIVSTQIN